MFKLTSVYLWQQRDSPSSVHLCAVTGSALNWATEWHVHCGHHPSGISQSGARTESDQPMRAWPGVIPHSTTFHGTGSKLHHLSPMLWLWYNEALNLAILSFAVITKTDVQKVSCLFSHIIYFITDNYFWIDLWICTYLSSGCPKKNSDPRPSKRLEGTRKTKVGWAASNTCWPRISRGREITVGLANFVLPRVFYINQISLSPIPAPPFKVSAFDTGNKQCIAC